MPLWGRYPSGRDRPCGELQRCRRYLVCLIDGAVCFVPETGVLTMAHHRSVRIGGRDVEGSAGIFLQFVIRAVVLSLNLSTHPHGVDKYLLPVDQSRFNTLAHDHLEKPLERHGPRPLPGFGEDAVGDLCLNGVPRKPEPIQTLGDSLHELPL